MSDIVPSSYRTCHISGYVLLRTNRRFNLDIRSPMLPRFRVNWPAQFEKDNEKIRPSVVFTNSNTLLACIIFRLLGLEPVVFVNEPLIMRIPHIVFDHLIPLVYEVQTVKPVRPSSGEITDTVFYILSRIEVLDDNSSRLPIDSLDVAIAKLIGEYSVSPTYLAAPLTERGISDERQSDLASFSPLRHLNLAPMWRFS